VPGPDHPVELQNLLFEPAQLCSENCETSAGYFRHSLVIWISDDIEQFLNTITADSGGNSELGKMGAYRIDHRDLLPHAQMTRSMKYHAALLLWSLGRHEPHVGSGDRLANGLCVSRIILLPAGGINRTV
jgi:hypothetical protein